MNQSLNVMVNMNKLLSICYQLAFQACEMIHKCSNDQSLKKYTKQNNDPVTQADLKIQTMILKAIKYYFPSLTVIGQENIQSTDKIHFDHTTLNSNKLPTHFTQQDLPSQDLCVWVDPIDCTKGFIGGYIHAVTVLIGISYKCAAYAGTVGIPFIKQQQKTIYNPKVLIGSLKFGRVYQINSKLQWKEVQVPKSSQPSRVVVSDSQKSKIQQEFQKHISGVLLNSGGSGYKILMVLRGEADVLLYLTGCTQKWDSCAGQALIKTLGGFYCDGEGNSIPYNPKNENQLNDKGQICTFDPKIKSSVIIFLHSENNK